MNISRNTRIAAIGTVVVALAAAGAAIGASKLRGGGNHAAAVTGLADGSCVDASSGGGYRFGGRGAGGPMSGHHMDGHHAGLSAAASYLGITESALMTQLQAGKTLAQIADATSGKSASGLIDALVAAEKTEIAADVTAGRLTQAQADTILKDLRARVTARVSSTGPGPGGFGHRHGHGDDLAAAATYLGISQSDLMTKLQSGKTLAQIADATSGKSKAGLVAALVAHEKDELAQAVKDGNLTQAQADAMAAGLQQRFTDMVDGTMPARPFDGPHAPPSSSGSMSSPEHI